MWLPSGVVTAEERPNRNASARTPSTRPSARVFIGWLPWANHPSPGVPEWDNPRYSGSGSVRDPDHPADGADVRRTVGSDADRCVVVVVAQAGPDELGEHLLAGAQVERGEEPGVRRQRIG